MLAWYGTVRYGTTQCDTLRTCRIFQFQFQFQLQLQLQFKFQSSLPSPIAHPPPLLFSLSLTGPICSDLAAPRACIPAWAPPGSRPSGSECAQRKCFPRCSIEREPRHCWHRRCRRRRRRCCRRCCRRRCCRCRMGPPHGDPTGSGRTGWPISSSGSGGAGFQVWTGRRCCFRRHCRSPRRTWLVPHPPWSPGASRCCPGSSISIRPGRPCGRPIGKRCRELLASAPRFLWKRLP
mmetsp:Transcript_3562/g.10032  ORF Transcript_3562/g.10032 Transcript_3562/m.10032 type:complete len:235 (-) Transcript_3562:347-1051(-)